MLYVCHGCFSFANFTFIFFYFFFKFKLSIKCSNEEKVKHILQDLEEFASLYLYDVHTPLCILFYQIDSVLKAAAPLCEIARARRRHLGARQRSHDLWRTGFVIRK